jgi:hypothetical protein
LPDDTWLWGLCDRLQVGIQVLALIRFPVREKVQTIRMPIYIHIYTYLHTYMYCGPSVEYYTYLRLSCRIGELATAIALNDFPED